MTDHKDNKIDVLLGLQWGDEGKGKIVDVFTPQYDLIARFQGGPNAGHTLEFEGKKIVLNTIPSGIFHSNTLNLIGNGVVIDPVVFCKELKNLEQYNVPINERLVISEKAHLILPTHPLLDAAHEKAKGDQKIGSTLRGIGPAYRDKISRNGVRIGDILRPDFKAFYDEKIEYHRRQLSMLGYNDDFSVREAAWFEAIETLKTLKIINGEQLINTYLEQGKKILAEGAQGTLLDIDFGSYPYVTSSNTITAGACTGLGVAPQRIGRVFGILKAYCTRVGSGPFPTEQINETGEKLRRIGREFGATTGRPRRCGWIDLVALKYAIRLNGTTHLILTKSDVLSGFEHIFACTHYIYQGEKIDYMPYNLANATPIFEQINGWQADLTQMKSYDALPATLQSYIVFLENALGVPVSVVSVGPDRAQTLLR
jgi:adenylosuccinate synthase